MPRPVLTIFAGSRPVLGLDALQDLADVRVVTDPADLPAALHGAEILYLWDYFADGLRSALPAADALRLIHVPAAGVDKLLFPDLAAADVTVTNARGIFDQAMAEYALTGILHFTKNIPQALRNQQERRWEYFRTGNLAGTRALITADGLGRTARDGDADFDAVHASTDFAQVTGEYDFIVLAAPLTAENRLVRTALRRLLGLNRVPATARQRLAHLDRQLDGVTLLQAGTPLPRWQETRHNQRYLPALRLAEIILRNSAAETGAGGIRVASFRVDMAKIFENFVEVALAEAIRSWGCPAASNGSSRPRWTFRNPRATSAFVEHRCRLAGRQERLTGGLRRQIRGGLEQRQLHERGPRPNACVLHRAKRFHRLAGICRGR